MNENIKINFAKVRFHIKEFQKVYILGGCSLVFYEPYHLQAKGKSDGEEFENEGGKKIHKEQEIVKMNSQEKKEEIISKEAAKAYAKEIDKEINALTENTYKEKINTQSQEKRKGKFKDYDIFYDVYTSKENKYKSVNKTLGFNPDGFEIDNGIVEVEAEFFQKCFQKGIYHLIPRLVSKQKDKDLYFDPMPLEDKGFVVTDFHSTKEKELTFQRKIAEIKNPDLTLQTPKEFHRMLNENRDFTQEDKLAQAQAIPKARELRVSEMEKTILEQDKSLKDIINDKEELKKKIKNLQDKKGKTSQETSLLGRLKFLLMNKNKAEDYKNIVENFKNNEEPIHSKNIGDTGECVASLLFEKKSTRHLSNRRKLDANFNTNGFNHTIPDFLVTLNDYPALVEVKNVQTQSLTEQISFELKLAREYELDYLFLCNHYTQLMDNITGLAEFNSNDANHTGSRKGFIYHKHANRSIKTIFKEIYLHHIKGAAPNKTMVKRLNLNDSNKLEEELNKNKSLQKV
ncbi:putative toxin [Helicobacter rodentium]|uniref:putative toxin n=1 Tax=Helicobacter rodentium TaxID=59617 RepID=UPI00047ED0A2|nr:putative toxin [Helicobacter rodentium]